MESAGIYESKIAVCKKLPKHCLRKFDHGSITVSHVVKLSFPVPPMQISAPPSPPVMTSSPLSPRMQSSPPSPSIVSAPELPRIRSLPAVPLNVPDPLTILVKNNAEQAGGLIFPALTGSDFLSAFEESMNRSAAKAVITLTTINAINPNNMI